MRILDNDSNKKVDDITLCLTQDEAQELRDTLEALLEKSQGNHGHISDYEAHKELNLLIYDPLNLDSSLQERVKKLIVQDV